MTKMIVLIYIEFSDIVEQITQNLGKYLHNFKYFYMKYYYRLRPFD